MSAASDAHPIAVSRVWHPTVSARTTRVASLTLFAVAFLWAFAGGRHQLAFWVLSGIVPFFTPASLAISVAATAQGIGSWGVVVVQFLAAGLGLITLLGGLRHLDEL